MKLSPEQNARLNAVTEAAKDYRAAKANLEVELRARLRLELDAELGGLKRRRDMAAFRAMQAGVPKSRIGIDGLGTKSPQSRTEAIEAGRIAMGSTLDDPDTRAALIEAATPKENPYVHQWGGFFAPLDPFRASDTPGRIWAKTYGGQYGNDESVTEETELYFHPDTGAIIPVPGASNTVYILWSGRFTNGYKDEAAAFLRRVIAGNG